MGGCHGLVVMGENSCSKGHAFESRHRILDGHDIFHIYSLKNCNDVCLKRPIINEKEAGVGSIFNNACLSLLHSCETLE